MALLLVTMVSMATFSWISNLLLSISKIEENAYRNVMKRNVTEYLSDVNMMAHPQGSKSLGGITINWTANLVEPIKKGKSVNGGKTPFDIGLYRVTVNVEDFTGERAAFELTQVGYRALSDGIF